MAQQEVLELVATAIDRATPALRQVRGSMDDLRDSGIKLDAESARNFAGMRRNINALIGGSEGLRVTGTRVKEVTTQFRGMSTGVQAATGMVMKEMIPAITLMASSLTAAVISIKSFQDNLAETRGVTQFVKNYEVARNTLRGLVEQGKYVDLLPEQVKAALAKTSEQFASMRFLGKEFYRNLLNIPGAQAVGAELVNILNNTNLSIEQRNDQALARLQKFLHEYFAQYGAVDTKKIIQALGLPDDVWLSWARLKPEEFLAKAHALAAAVREFDPVAVDKYNESMFKLRIELNNLSVRVLGPIIKPLTEFIDEVARMMKAEPGEYWLVQKLTDAATALKPIWADIKSDFDTGLEAIKREWLETTWPKLKVEIELAVGDLAKFVRDDWPRWQADIVAVHAQLKNALEGRPIEWSKVLGVATLDDISKRIESVRLHLIVKFRELQAATGVGKPEELEAARREEAEHLKRSFPDYKPPAGPSFNERWNGEMPQRFMGGGPGTALPSDDRINPVPTDEQLAGGIAATNPYGSWLAPAARSSWGRSMLRGTMGRSGAAVDPNAAKNAFLSGSPMSSNIEDRRNEEDNTRALKDVTEELRKINDEIMRGQFFTGGGAGVGTGGPGVGGGPGAGVGPMGSTAPMGTLPGWGGTGRKAIPVAPGAQPPVEQFTPGGGQFGPPPGGFTPGYKPNFVPDKFNALPSGQVGQSGQGGSEVMAGGADQAQANMQRYIKGIGFLETSLKPNEAARSEAGNTGFFKFNANDARRAAKAGLPDPRSGSLEQQTDATRQYIERFFPQAAAHIKAGNFPAAHSQLNKFWVSLPGGSQPQNASRYAEHARILAEGSNYSQTAATQQATKVALAQVKRSEIEVPSDMFSSQRTQTPQGGAGGVARLDERGAHGYQRGNVQTEPWLVDTVRNATKALPEGYRAEVISTVDARARTPWHPGGRAIDVSIYDPQGRKIPNVGKAPGTPEYAIYERMGLAARQYAAEKYPKQTFTWGGHFNSGVPLDLMHFQSGGVSARNFTREQLAQSVMPNAPSVPTRMLATRATGVGVAGEGAPDQPNLAGMLGHQFTRDVGTLGHEPGALGAKAAEAHKIEGSADLNVNVNAPRGTKVSTETDGKLFKKIEMNRNLSEQPADQQGGEE